jgi:hypothetical protein
MTGDQIKLAAGSGTLKLDQPLLLSSGVDIVGVVPSASGAGAGGRHLMESEKGLVFECRKAKSAVTIM